LFVHELEIQEGDPQRPLFEILENSHDLRLLIHVRFNLRVRLLIVANHVQKSLSLFVGQHVVEENVVLAHLIAVLQATLQHPLLRADLLENMLSKFRQARRILAAVQVVAGASENPKEIQSIPRTKPTENQSGMHI
jgi:hypothetical protein